MFWSFEIRVSNLFRPILLNQASFGFRVLIYFDPVLVFFPFDFFDDLGDE